MRPGKTLATRGENFVLEIRKVRAKRIGDKFFFSYVITQAVFMVF